MAVVFERVSETRPSNSDENLITGLLFDTNSRQYQFGFLKDWNVLAWLDREGQEVQDGSEEWETADNFLRLQFKTEEVPAPPMKEEESLRAHRAAQTDWPRNARTKKRIGIGYSSLETALKASDPKKTYIIHGTAASHIIDSDIRRRIYFDSRAMVVVLGGLEASLRLWLQELIEPDYIVVVAAPDVIERLGLEVVDSQGQKPKLLDDYLFIKRIRRKNASNQSGGSFSEPVKKTIPPKKVTRPRTVTKSMSGDIPSEPPPIVEENEGLEVDDAELSQHAQKLIAEGLRDQGGSSSETNTEVMPGMRVSESFSGKTGIVEKRTGDFVVVMFDDGEAMLRTEDLEVAQ